MTDFTQTFSGSAENSVKRFTSKMSKIEKTFIKG